MQAKADGGPPRCQCCRCPLSLNPEGAGRSAASKANGQGRHPQSRRLSNPVLPANRALGKVQVFSPGFVGSRLSFLWLIATPVADRRHQALDLALPRGIIGPGAQQIAPQARTGRGEVIAG